ncbi:MAG: LysM peptidoglycan-binding domain-containing M23 family metallopeptidase [Rickettsia endosymbiont of Culicoides impunctatus]|uniref:LysM peptidoglycan-binding domain-containing M23 family metallopeptidase n=1 Tax=Candidatus Tisiphia endosymbiont of Dioctria rufipes TaxID=3066255 RepID=UPI001E80267E|nr:MAG: LysM peptidoglycan-binding domain-containing M23 family metallopeptidase [Rickettsia endosymbiont of Culicoides impunctatus]
MKNNIFFIYFVIFMVSGCATQLPAPIEYNRGKNFSQKATTTKPPTTTYSENNHISESDEGEIIGREIDEKEKEFDAPTGFLQERHAIKPQNQDDIIIVPKVKLDDNKIIYREVQSGETLESIANEYGQTVEQLAELNNMSAPYHLSKSQIIMIKVNTELLNKKNQERSIRKSTIREMENATKFIKPIDGKITIKFGEQTSKGKSKGINIAAKEGANVKSIASGKVMFAGNDTKFGNLLIVKLDNSDLYVAYAYLQDLIVQKGATVSQGEVIGHVGGTGDAEYPQLHFAIRQGKLAVDPLQYVNY